MVIFQKHKYLKLFTSLIVAATLLYTVFFLAEALPILSGYGAKTLCSCVYNSNRTASDVLKNELGTLPFSLGTFRVREQDAVATGSVFGLAKRKAVFRKGLGCTLVSELSEKQVRENTGFIPAPPPVNTDSITWPLGNKHADSVFTGINDTKLKGVVRQAFTETTGNNDRKTRAVIIVYKGKIIAERYAPGFNQHTRQTGWSMTKSITNALVGILVKKRQLRVGEKKLFPAWSDGRKEITIDQLLHANSGLEWKEEYSNPSPATRMLFTKARMGNFALDFPLQYEPGSHFRYSSGTSNILSLIIRSRTATDYYGFPYLELFYKTGMYSAVLEPDAGGTYVGSSYCFATARDWARFGLLYLNDGVVDGTRILPEGWVRYTTTPAKGSHLGEYGAQFWLNAGAAGNPLKRLYPQVPTDCFWADGYEGQSVWIIPSKQLVVVRLGLTRNRAFDENGFLAGIIAAL